MAVVTMKRLVLLGLLKDRESILDALAKGKTTELKNDIVIENTRREDTLEKQEVWAGRISRVENCISVINEQIETLNNEVKSKKDKLKKSAQPFSRPLIELSYEDFVAVKGKEAELLSVVEEVERTHDTISELTKQIANYQNEKNKLELYAPLTKPVSFYQSTANVYVSLGTIPQDNFASFVETVENNENAEYQKISENADNVLVAVVALLQENEFIDSLRSLGFVNNTLALADLPKQRIEKLEKEIESNKILIHENRVALSSKSNSIPSLKVLSDFYLLQRKKDAADGEMSETDYTFVLEGWCPAEKEQQVQSSVFAVTQNCILNFYDIKEDEFAPTLNRNNKFVRAFENITNGYTPQNYHEPDPNPPMSVFYFIILGLMTADVGYGLVLALAGFLAGRIIKQKTGIKTLLTMFGIGGFSAMIWGILFNSYFCYSLPFYASIIPSPSDYPMVTIAISLGVGILHLITGFVCNAVKLLKRKDVMGAISEGFVWAVFMVGLGLTAVNYLFSMIMENCPPQFTGVTIPDFTIVGLCVMGVALVVVLFTAGHSKKGFIGKAVGGLGGIYGVINYFSDVISYVRVFGILLSGAVFGSIINDLSSSLGLFAPFLLVFAHAFNLILALLSVYVHNARLQYVEFFGKFFEGEGRLFTPFGSDLNYTLNIEKQ